VPEALRAIIGKREVWKSLGTDSPTVAVRRSHDVAATIERYFEEARARSGLSVDHRILARLGASVSTSAKIDLPESVAVGPSDPTPGVTLRELYDAYMSDPTRDWSPRTRLAYDTTRRLVLAIVGEATAVRSITRAHCRTLIDTLRWMPRNALKLYPCLSPIENAAKAKEAERNGPDESEQHQHLPQQVKWLVQLGGQGRDDGPQSRQGIDVGFQDDFTHAQRDGIAGDALPDAHSA